MVKKKDTSSKDKPKAGKKSSKKSKEEKNIQDEEPEIDNDNESSKPKSTKTNKTQGKSTKSKSKVKSSKDKKNKENVNEAKPDEENVKLGEEKEACDMKVGTIETGDVTPGNLPDTNDNVGDTKQTELSNKQMNSEKDDDGKTNLDAETEAEMARQKNHGGEKEGDCEGGIVYNTEEDNNVKTCLENTWNVNRKLTRLQAENLIKQVKILVKQNVFLQQQTDKYLASDELIMQIDDTFERTISRNKLLLIFKISDFANKMEEAKDDDPDHRGIEFSPVFRTSPQGYRLGMSVVLNGDGPSVKGNYMSIFFCILRGDYDGILPWPFARHLSFSLLDQNVDVEKREHHVKIFRPRLIKQNVPFLWRPGKQGRNPSMGIPKFVSHEVLKNGNYIKENQIFIRVELND